MSYLTDHNTEALAVSQDISRIGALAAAVNLIASGASLPPGDPRTDDILVNLVDLIEYLSRRSALMLSEIQV